MYSIRKGIIFDNLDPELQESLRNLGFHEGDNLSEIFQGFLDKREITLDDYISKFYYLDMDRSISKSFKLSTTAMTLNKDAKIVSFLHTKTLLKDQEKIKVKEKNIFGRLISNNKFGGIENVRFTV